MKAEGLQFLYEIYDSFGWDNIDLADLEMIIAVVKKLEVEK